MAKKNETIKEFSFEEKLILKDKAMELADYYVKPNSTMEHFLDFSQKIYEYLKK